LVAEAVVVVLALGRVFSKALSREDDEKEVSPLMDHLGSGDNAACARVTQFSGKKRGLRAPGNKATLGSPHPRAMNVEILLGRKLTLDRLSLVAVEK
jgi:hypothetical protein